MRVEVFLIIILLLISVYLFARLFLIKKNIKKFNKDFQEVLDCDGKTNPIIHTDLDDRDFEDLVSLVNSFVIKRNIEKNTYINREEEMKMEISNISHDLRTPLTSIIGYVSLINSGSQKEVEEYTEIIERRAKNLEKLINQFYDYSRLNDTTFNFAMDKMDIRRVMCDHILEYYCEFEGRGIEVNMDVGEKPVYINGNKDAIIRVLNNITGNAIKYTINTLFVALKCTNDKVVITYKNPANGLNELDTAHLFDRFYMKDKSRSHNSTGLGLTIAKQITEKLNGTISAELEDEWLVLKIEFPLIIEQS